MYIDIRIGRLTISNDEYEDPGIQIRLKEKNGFTRRIGWDKFSGFYYAKHDGFAYIERSTKRGKHGRIGYSMQPDPIIF